MAEKEAKVEKAKEAAAPAPVTVAVAHEAKAAKPKFARRKSKKTKATKSLPFRRRREKKTDYAARLRMLQGGRPRLVVRITNRRVIAQLFAYDSKGDKVLASADSKEFEKSGWKWKKNSAAAYLVGLLCAKRAAEKKISEAVLDMGLRTAIKGGRVFATLKGAIDGGLNIPCDAELLPKEDRIIGKDADNFNKLKNGILEGRGKKEIEKDVAKKGANTNQEKTIKKPKKE